MADFLLAAPEKGGKVPSVNQPFGPANVGSKIHQVPTRLAKRSSYPH